MKKELYKNMYEKVRMDDGRKAEMLIQLKELETAEAGRRKRRIPSYVALGLCLFAVSNATVYAAVHLNVADRLENAIDDFLQTKRNLSEKQKDIYTDYSRALDSRIEIENGTMELEAVLYDEYYAYIPFRITPDDASSFPVKEDVHQYLLKELCDQYYFSLERTQDVLGAITYVNPERQEDGSYIGNYLLSAGEDTLKQGDVLQFQKGDWEENGGKEQMCGVTLNQKVKSVDLDVASVPQQNGMKLGKVVISPLSVRVEGSCQQEPVPDCEITVVRKDGSQVRHAKSGAESAYGEKGEQSGSCFYTQVLFESPVSLDEVKEIRMENKKTGMQFVIPAGTSAQ